MESWYGLLYSHYGSTTHSKYILQKTYHQVLTFSETFYYILASAVMVVSTTPNAWQINSIILADKLFG